MNDSTPAKVYHGRARWQSGRAVPQRYDRFYSAHNAHSGIT